MDFQFRYDPELDILYLAREGQETSVEISPEANLEFDAEGNVIGIEILNASRLMKDVIEQIQDKSLTA
ncbi:MAG: DUF2283 domain-containing protein [Chloroflexota bacterium]|nr:DUF2283 domain-containing protein [Chloroflexota bacterium]